MSFGGLWRPCLISERASNPQVVFYDKKGTHAVLPCRPRHSACQGCDDDYSLVLSEGTVLYCMRFFASDEIGAMAMGLGLTLRR